MNELQYVLLWASGVLLSIGAFTGRARTASGLLSMFVWFVLGNASFNVVRLSQAQEFTYSTESVAWLCYGAAIMGLVATIVGIKEHYDDTDSAAEQEARDLLTGGQNV